jgi:hypothetical protein
MATQSDFRAIRASAAIGESQMDYKVWAYQAR